MSAKKNSQMGGALARFDRFQQARPWLAIPIATGKRFGADGASNYAVVLTFYGFFCIFPLLLVFLTILGYVLAGDSSAMHSVSSSVLGRFPVIGSTISNHKLRGSGLALAVGVVLSLYSGLGITGSARQAFDHVWAVPKREQVNWWRGKLHGVLLLVLLGAMFVVGSGASGVVSGGLGGLALVVVGYLLSLAVNFGLFMLCFRLLCSERPAWRALVPGAVLAAILWAILQALGGAYIGHFKDSDTAYGTFAVVLGILAWLHIGAQVTMFCAELNVVLARKLWPAPLRARPEQPAAVTAP
ncbi:MAG TPA: YihY/virulence factor BrkB family protein [Solirubrobacteraceae bacterium]|nr:YihY/virulence factor BrkB family protein [Solirubrobacteraceae bacterium]